MNDIIEGHLYNGIVYMRAVLVHYSDVVTTLVVRDQSQVESVADEPP